MNYREVLNPYKIVWSVEVQSNGNVKLDHFPNLETLKKRVKPKKGVTVYHITDKQFGMIQNSFNGEEKPLPEPFKRKVVRRDGNMIQVIPLSENQFNNPIHV